MSEHISKENYTLEDIIEADRWARKFSAEVIA